MVAVLVQYPGVLDLYQDQPVLVGEKSEIGFGGIGGLCSILAVGYVWRQATGLLSVFKARSGFCPRSGNEGDYCNLRQSVTLESYLRKNCFRAIFSILALCQAFRSSFCPILLVFAVGGYAEKILSSLSIFSFYAQTRLSFLCR